MKLRRVFPLIIAFVFLPAALMLTVGILILVFGSAARDYLFGSLIVALVATTVIGTAATLAVLYREARISRLQTDFVNKVSHDLRTPLTSIRMFVETLQMGRLRDDPAREREAFEIITDEVARLSSLINRLLDWARMESGKRSYNFEPCEVGALVDSALSAFEPQLLHDDADVVRDVPPGLPRVRGDVAALGDALLNLLQNAHKYTGPEKKITVSARTQGPTVLVTVSDNGPGIAGADQKRIFDKFYRAKDPLDRTIEGSGLGLSMVKHIVEAHKGTVTVASQPGHGAAFTIALPAATQERRAS
ncbi:MAG: two-component sensor histidine kinase [Anaeromyxobacter sp. RBG_16_69_14]|nr:MAG: two-component sensor histidine kinase [Anaeromyxobacter sp. RBG_16_69_14]